MNVSEMANAIATRIEKIDASKKEPIGLYVTDGDLYLLRIATAAPANELVWAIPDGCVRDGFTQKQWWDMTKRLDALRKAGRI